MPIFNLYDESEKGQHKVTGRPKQTIMKGIVFKRPFLHVRPEIECFTLSVFCLYIE